MSDLITESARYLSVRPIRQGSNQNLAEKVMPPRGYRIRYQTMGQVYHKDPKTGKDKIYTSMSAAQDDIRTLKTNFYNPFPEPFE